MCSQKCARPEMFAGSDKEPVNSENHFRFYLVYSSRAFNELTAAASSDRSEEGGELLFGPDNKTIPQHFTASY